MDSPRRSLVKALIWNVMGLVVMAGVGLAMTGSLAVGGAMAAINTCVGLTMYVIYERVWDRIRWGRHV